MGHTDPTIPSSSSSPTSGAPAPLPGEAVVMEGPGTVLGAYKILQTLGEGGFGIVYLAEQREPVERRVALKIIKLGLETGEVLARFEAERQALALMDHPSIAKVLDAGATSTGRPFFVMEYVAGVPVHEYCDQHRLTTSERLKLFVAICSAVHHAHQKGIIHRDLKPSNILVTLIDGKPAPKVIDFGIAKATTRRLTEKTIFTETGRMLGTPEYMSPEQAGTTGLDVDTRTDVYSLGVVLYQLLVGALPFDPRTLRSAGYEGIMRIIREQDPPRMSTKLSGNAGTMSDMAEKRRSDTRTLVEELRGDLDWITARAMEKDRNRRYASVSELSADVERFLKDEPVVARPPSVVYKTGKFVRRHRVGVTAAAAVTVALVAGLAGTTTYMLKARRAEAAERDQRVLAEAAKEQAEQATLAETEAKKRAQREAAKAMAVNAFMQNTLAAVSPASTNKQDLTVREVLDEARRVGGGVSFKDQPDVQASLRNTLGRTYRALGIIDQAETLLMGAFNARKELYGAEHVEVAESLDDLSVLRHLQGRYDEAERLAKEALEMRKKLLGAEHSAVGDSYSNLGLALQARGRLGDAKAATEQGLAIHQKGLGPTHPSTLQSMRNLGSILWLQGEGPEAVRIYQQLQAVQEALPDPESRELARTLANLGEIKRRRNELGEAEELLRRSLAIRQKVLAPYHPEVGESLGNLGLVLQAKGDMAGAEAMFRASLEVARNGPGGARADIDYDYQTMANFLLDRGNAVEAEAMAREAHARRIARTSADSPETGFTLLVLGRSLVDQGRAAEGEPLLRQAVGLVLKAVGPNNLAVFHTRSALGGALVAVGKLDEAEPLLMDAYVQIASAQGKDHLRAKQTASRLAALYQAKGDEAKSAEWRGKAGE